MYRKDYIQRKIDEAIKALARLLEELKELKEQDKLDEAIETTLRQLQQQVDIDLAAMLKTPDEELLNQLVHVRAYTNEHLKYLADILYEYTGTLADAYEIRASQKKSLALYEHIAATETEALHYEILQRIALLRAELAG